MLSLFGPEKMEATKKATNEVFMISRPPVRANRSDGMGYWDSALRVQINQLIASIVADRQPSEAGLVMFAFAVASASKLDSWTFRVIYTELFSELSFLL